MKSKKMSQKEIKDRLDELEFHVLKNPTADFQKLTNIIFDRINKLRSLLTTKKN